MPLVKPATDHTHSRYDLVDAFAHDGCAVCRLASQRLAHYFEAINHEAIGDPGVRERFAEAGGYCNAHAWQWLHSAYLLGTATLYRDLMQRIRQDVETLTWQPTPLLARVGKRFGNRSSGRDSQSESCAACTWQQEMETMLATTVAENLHDPAFRTACEASSGFCLPHFRQIIARVKTAEDFTLLKQQMLRQETTLLADLAEIIRKHDYRYQNEPPGTEKGGATRATAHHRGFHGRTSDPRRAAN
jgi:hypothetical protein